MRSAMFVKLDRNAIQYRDTPARRLAVILSILFLLSLSTVAAVTSIRAGNGEQDATRIPIAPLPPSTTH